MRQDRITWGFDLTSDSKERVKSDRRSFLQASGLSLAYVLGSQTLWLSPDQAFAKQLPYQRLTDTEVDTLEWLSETIAPGARTAGVAHYLDAQLAATSDSCLLMIKYLGVPAPYDGFYQSALQAAHQLALSTYTKPWRSLSDTQRETLTDQIASGNVDGWQGPPPGFFFFVLRADATDVVYGTQLGHESIGFPHMPHIQATEEW